MIAPNTSTYSSSGNSAPTAGRAWRIAVLGAGPAGASVAALLAQEGHLVVCFDRGDRPKLIAGESLVPAIVPIFQRLGIEDRVKAIAKNKPGVSFLWPHHEPLHLSFADVGKRVPTYAYNVPRPDFDQVLAERAEELGVEMVRRSVEVSRADGDAVRLDDEAVTASRTLGGQQPDLVIDATGRRRTIAKLMDLPTSKGDRHDVAYFAHFENLNIDGLPDGQVRTGFLERGWSWIIPLPSKQSVGAVVPTDHARGLGKTAEERLHAIIERDEYLSQAARDASRITDVITYSNYQMIAQRGFGSNWVLIGDAFGFVDPMLSPGMFIAMKSGEMITDAVNRAVKKSAVDPSRRRFEKELRRYEREVFYWHDVWQRFIDYFYDGRIFAMREAGEDLQRNYPNRFSESVAGHMGRWVARMATGVDTRSKYGWALLRFTEKLGMRHADPSLYCVR